MFIQLSDVHRLMLVQLTFLMCDNVVQGQQPTTQWGEDQGDGGGFPPTTLQDLQLSLDRRNTTGESEQF